MLHFLADRIYTGIYWQDVRGRVSNVGSTINGTDVKTVLTILKQYWQSFRQNMKSYFSFFEDVGTSTGLHDRFQSSLFYSKCFLTRLKFIKDKYKDSGYKTCFNCKFELFNILHRELIADGCIVLTFHLSFEIYNKLFLIVVLTSLPLAIVLNYFFVFS